MRSALTRTLNKYARGHTC
ncbi:MAG: hypothetical protein ACKOQ0_06890 [Solirubrobacterales bacterium]